ncbi:hypothetical protein Tsubulata_017414 [Turnera subulata]|uniref:Uncharacterized protein n=1 Tax=Turnera subulata TaxID=218843 RepID=A0A9Q0G8G8_9ROSI|nr:hypothetical protein Tsubulata_017414 [Turnera subulata]
MFMCDFISPSDVRHKIIEVVVHDNSNTLKVKGQLSIMRAYGNVERVYVQWPKLKKRELPPGRHSFTHPIYK